MSLCPWGVMDALQELGQWARRFYVLSDFVRLLLRIPHPFTFPPTASDSEARPRLTGRRCHTFTILFTRLSTHCFRTRCLLGAILNVCFRSCIYKWVYVLAGECVCTHTHVCACVCVTHTGGHLDDHFKFSASTQPHHLLTPGFSS